MSFTPFSLSEEAFLLKSLSEVTKVWASATGKATFNFSVQEGQAHLQLGFQLGRPGNHHLPPQPPGSNKTKTSFRKERDRLRAAEHQARKEVVPTTVPKTFTCSFLIFSQYFETKKYLKMESTEKYLLRL